MRASDRDVCDLGMPLHRDAVGPIFWLDSEPGSILMDLIEAEAQPKENLVGSAGSPARTACLERPRQPLLGKKQARRNCQHVP